jgi:hypothetical protein
MVRQLSCRPLCRLHFLEPGCGVGPSRARMKRAANPWYASRHTNTRGTHHGIRTLAHAVNMG